MANIVMGIDPILETMMAINIVPANFLLFFPVLYSHVFRSCFFICSINCIMSPVAVENK